MKRIVLTFVMTIAVCASLFAFTPENNGSKKLSRAEKKELREKEAIENVAKLKTVLESRQWVLEADRLTDRYGNTGFVQSTINFVGITGESATVQMGVSEEMGLNGLGGITLDGKVNKYKLKEGKNPSSGLSLEMSVSGAMMGHTLIRFNISPGGFTTATVTDIEGNRLTYTGRLVPLNESTVYKGSSYN